MNNQDRPSGAGTQRPSQIARRFDHSQLPGHFLLGRSLPVEPVGWCRAGMEGWTLTYEPHLPVIELLDTVGSRIGWLLGQAIELESATLITHALRAPVLIDDHQIGQTFEDWLYAFGGRFAAIVLRPTPVIYPDAAATLPVLFDAELQCAASSPFLLCSPDGAVPDSPLVDTIAVFEAGGCFTLGATPHARAELLLPNHVLDLARWWQSRVWPKSSSKPDDVETLVERVATVLCRTCSALTAAGRPNVGLTAGGDSRALVACSRHVLDRTRFFTVAFPDDLGATDLATAPALAQRFGLEHRILPWIEPSTDDVDLFMYRTGCLVGNFRARRATRSYNQLGDRDVYVSGLGMEMTWCRGWRRHDNPATQIRADDLLYRFGYPTHPELVRRANDWLAALPEGLNGVDVLTLYWLEGKLGVLGGGWSTGYPEACSSVQYPFLHRTMVDAALHLPWQYRYANSFRSDIIAARWKGLLDVPFNRPSAGVAMRKRAAVARGHARAGLSPRVWKRLFTDLSRNSHGGA